MEIIASQNAAENQVVKIKRGKTRAAKWKKKRDVINGKVAVEIPPCLQRVVGPNAQQFITETSYLVKQHCPLDVKNWAAISQDIKDRLMSRVKEMYEFPNHPHVDRAIWRVLMKRFRDWRYNLGRIYKRLKTDKERLSHCPSEIDNEKWKWLVNYWGSEKYRRISETNAANRRKQKMLACVGTKSIARIANEMRMCDTEEVVQEPEYLRLFVKQRQRKNGKWVDVEAEEAYQKLLNLHEEQLKTFGADNLSTAEAYTRILGHRSGYLRGMGEGPPPLKHARNYEEYNSQPVLTEPEFQAKLKVELEAYSQKRDAELQQTIEALQKKFQDEVQAQMRKLREEFTSGLSSQKLSNPSSIPLEEAMNGSSVAGTIDEGLNDSPTHNQASCPVKEYANASVLSQRNSSSTRLNEVVNAVNPPLEHLNEPMHEHSPSIQADEDAGLVCVICQVTLTDIEAYMKHMKGIQHKATMAKFYAKKNGGPGKLLTRKIKREK